MPLNDSISSLANATVSVKRRVKATFAAGVKVAGALTTITGVTGVITPAFNLNRIIGGADLDARVDNQSSTNILQFHTVTELFTRTDTNEPDIVVYRGKDYTVARCEEWEIDGEIHFHAVLTLATGGAA